MGIWDKDKNKNEIGCKDILITLSKPFYIIYEEKFNILNMDDEKEIELYNNVKLWFNLTLDKKEAVK